MFTVWLKLMRLIKKPKKFFYCPKYLQFKNIDLSVHYMQCNQIPELETG